jgi:hypothetical protein
MKRDQWASHIEDWKRSGLHAAEYGKRHGVDPKKLYWWSWFLRAHPAPTRARAVKVPLVPIARTALLPVTVRRTEGRASTRAATYTSGGSVDVTLPGGAVIRAPSSVDPVWLGRVIIAGTGPC